MAKRKKQKTIKRRIAPKVSPAAAIKSATVADCDHGDLLRMLTYRRPYGGETVDQFCAEFLDHIDAITIDGFGNRLITVGDDQPSTLFSSHTDTVHLDDGRQKIIVDQFSGLVYKDDDQPLGADCATGIYIMLKMIAAKIPGLYIFHAGEEIGGLGSAWIVENNPSLLDNIDRAIAFDRKLDHSVITEQCSGRCCSDTFAQAIADQLGGKFKIDPTGSFTDTANYIDLVSECTNISVGYDCEHTAAEYQDLSFLDQLIPALIALDWQSLPIDRDHTAADCVPRYTGIDSDPVIVDYLDAIHLIETDPDYAADLLYQAYGRDHTVTDYDPDRLAWGDTLDDTGRDHFSADLVDSMFDKRGKK